MAAWPEAGRWAVARELAITDFRLKYYDSALGYAWSMLSPLLMLAIYYFVFVFIIGIRTPGYLVYLLVGVVYWTFFQDCTFSGLNALASKSGLLKAVPVRPSLVVAAGILSTVITLLINSMVLVLALGLAGKLSPRAFLALGPLLCLVLLASGLSFLVAAAHARFRDTGLLWTVALQALFWLTPVVYVLAPGPLAEVLYLNPLARCLHLIRWFLLYDYLPSARFMVLTAAACAGAFALGLGLFLRREVRMPEDV